MGVQMGREVLGRSIVSLSTPRLSAVIFINPITADWAFPTVVGVVELSTYEILFFCRGSDLIFAGIVAALTLWKRFWVLLPLVLIHGPNSHPTGLFLFLSLVSSNSHRYLGLWK